jgi:pyruvate dehydrogenase E1 component alpha subunit
MLRGGDAVAACFFSEGAAGAGPMHEVLNIAALWRLPLVLVCENNGYAAENAHDLNLSMPDASALAEPHGIARESVDGNDVLAVYAAAGRAVERARAGEGATLLEARTFRLGGHAFRGARPEERDPELLEAWAARDPLKRTRADLRSLGLLDDAALEASIQRLLDEAVAFAEASPFPEPADALAGLYAA